MTSFITFPLVENTKTPAIKEWQNLTRSEPRFKENQNKGVLCGKKSGIIVLDLDLYKFPSLNKSEFVKRFGNNYHFQINTYTVFTTSRGLHLYFQYDGDFPQKCVNSTHHIDILSNNSYAVAGGSRVNDKKYKRMINAPIKKMPEELKEWLLLNVYNPEKTIETRTIQSESSFEYVFSDNQLLEILGRIPQEYLNDYDKWLKITSILKKINNKTVWDKWSKTSSKYDYYKNLKVWEQCDPNKVGIELLFKLSKVKSPFGFYRPVDYSTPKPTLKINTQYLGAHEPKILTRKKNLVIKSDTGTGKTTAFNQYVKDNELMFVSLVSRVELGREQSINLEKMGVETKFYKDDEFDWGDNIIICADSLLRLEKFDWSKYVIFVDEFNSVIEYIQTSTTKLKEFRNRIYGCLINMLESCNQFICVDADISPASFKFLNNINVKFQYVKNEYQKFKDVDCNIYNDLGEFLEVFKKSKKFILASDSATRLLELKKENNFYCLTSKTSENGSLNDYDEYDNLGGLINYTHLDSYDKIGFSPIVIYGQDSTKKREVFAYFKGHTITPPQMVQQIARCRNPTKVHIYYENPVSKFPKFYNDEDLNLHIKDTIDFFINNNSNLQNSIEGFLGSCYYEVQKDILFKYDSFETSKYYHLLNILIKRGFKVKITGNKTDNKKILKELKDHRMEYEEQATLNEFIKYKNNELTKKDIVHRINYYFKIPEHEQKEYIEFYNNPFLRYHHLNYCSYIKGEDIKELNEKINKNGDFFLNKVSLIENKKILMYKMMKKLNIDFKTIDLRNFLRYDKLEDFIKINKNDEELKSLSNEYKKVFNIKKHRNVDFTEHLEFYKCFGVILKDIFGKLITGKRIQIKGQKRWTRYEFDEKFIKYHNKLLEFRKMEKVNIEDVDFFEDD